MFQKKVIEKIKTHFEVQKLLFENRAVYELICKNVVEPDRSQMTIWRLHIACWIPKARDAYSEYLILTVFPPQKRLPERPSVLLCRYIACPAVFDFAYFIRLHAQFF